MKVVIVFFLVFSLHLTQKIEAQEIAAFDDLYVENDLLYNVSDESLFTGICERRRKNGHLVVEEKIENGVILLAKYYYNGRKKIMSDSVIYNAKKPYKYKAIYRFSSKSELTEKESFDDYGKLILKEEFEEGKLVYSCEYNDKKKHGKEFCYSKDGEPLEFKYINGKKIKDK